MKWLNFYDLNLFSFCASNKIFPSRPLRHKYVLILSLLIMSAVLTYAQPVVNQPANQTFCNNVISTPDIFTGSLPDTTFYWTIDNPSLGLASSGVGNIPAFAPTNSGNTPVTATITVTPILPGKAFVANTGLSTVSVINTLTNSIGASILVGGAPFGVAVSPDQKTAYVANYTPNNVSVINTLTNAVTATIPVGTNPYGITVSPDGTRVYVANGASSNVTVINAITNTVITTVDIGGHPLGVDVSPDGTKVYVSNFYVPELTVIDAITNTVVTTVPVGDASWGVCVSNDGTKVYVANNGDNNVSVYNTSTNTVEATIPVGDSPRGLAVSPDGTKVYVANDYSNNVSIINTTTNAVDATIPAGNGPQGLSVSADGTKLYVVNNYTSSISVINTVTNTIIASAPSVGFTQCLGNFIVEPVVGSPKTFTITVNPSPTLNPVVNQTLCNNTSSTAVNFIPSVAGTFISWTNNTPSIGLAASGSGNINSFTAVNNTNAPIVATITVTPSYTNNGTTCTAPFTFTITVNPEPASIQPSNQVLCNGSPTTSVIFTSLNMGGDKAYSVSSFEDQLFTINSTTYTVTDQITATMAGFTIQGMNCIDFDPSSEEYYVIVRVGNAPNQRRLGTINTTTGVITDKGALGDRFSYITFAPDGRLWGVTGNGANCASCLYSINKTNAVTTFIRNLTNAGSGEVICFNPADNFLYHWSGSNVVYEKIDVSLYNITPIGMYNSGIGEGETFGARIDPVTGDFIVIDIELNVERWNTSGPVSTLGSTDNYYRGLLIVSPDEFNWTNSDPSIGLASSGSGDIPSFTAFNTTTAPITASIAVTQTFTNGGVTCSGVPQVFTITVNPIPNAAATPISQSACSGEPITTINLSSAVTGTTFAWTRDNTGPVTGIAATGSGNISGTLTNTTNAPVTVNFTITPTANNCQGTPITATVIVNPTPNVVATPTVQTICSATTITPITFSGALGGTTFNWIRDNTTAVTGIAASGSGDISGILTNTTNAPVTVTFTVTPVTIGCAGPSITVTVIVNPTPDAIATPTSQAVCSGALITTISLSGAVAGTTFAWTRDNTASVTGIAAAGSGNISGTLINTTTAPVTITFSITPTANGCVGATTTATVIVNPNPNVVATPSSQTICSAISITPIIFTGAVSGTTYDWTRDNTAAVTGIAASGSGDISGMLTNTTNAPVTVTFTITPTANGCAGSAITVAVIVNPTPNSIATPSSQTICSASLITTIVISGDVGGTTFTWTRNNTATVTGIAANGTGNISGALTNTTSAPVMVTFTITPTANSCAGTPITATVIVNPLPNVIATPSTQTICSGSGITTIVLSGNVTGSTYTWTRNNTATVTGIAANGSGNISGVLTNVTTAPVTVTFTITPVANGCTGIPITATVIVSPIPNAIATPSSQSVCSGNTINPIVLSGSISGTTYNWTRDNSGTVTGIPAFGSGNISGILTNNTTAPITVTFTITPAANNCIGNPVTATVIVNPNPVGTISISPNPACVGSTVQLLSGGGSTYSWSGPQGFISTEQNPSIVLNSHLQAGLYSVTITSAAGCFVEKSAMLRVNYPPVAEASYEVSTACTGSNLKLHGLGAGTYSWSGPAGFTSNLKDPEVPNVTSNNSGIYILTVTSPNGCTSTAMLNITINTPPALSANPTVTFVCEGSKIQFFATGTGSFEWNGPATYSSNVQNPVIENIPIHMSGTYTVELTASNGCTSSASVEVKVYDQIKAVATASEDTICEGQSLQLHAEGGSAYLWTGPNGFNSTESDPRIDNISPAAAGKYYVFISNAGGCWGYAELTIVISPVMKSYAFATPNPVTENGPAQFTASDNGIAYSWEGPLGFTSTLQNPYIKKVTRYMAGIYTVTITNENQCPGIVKVNLKVIYTNKSKTMVASEEQAIDIRTDKTGTIYPNPTNDLIYFDTESKSLIEYIIYDMSGNIRTLKNTTGDGYISTSHLTSGIYQIRWKSEGSEEWITNKFVKIK